MSTVVTHNKRVLQSLEEGDRIEFERGIYNHWGIYCGDGEVIHLTGVDDRMESNIQHSFTISGARYEKAMVKMSDFHQVCDGNKAHKNNKMDEKNSPRKTKDITGTAKKYLDRTVPYNLFGFNCEHFATWCRNDIAHSQQVQDVADAAGTVGTGILVAVVVGAASYLGLNWWRNRRNEDESDY